MSDVDVEWSDGSPEDIAARISRLDDALQDELEKAMKDIVQKIAADAARLAPVDEGTLRSSIRGIVLPMMQGVVKGAVGSNVSYAPHQEFGTEDMEPNSYLRPAIEANRDYVIERTEEAIRRAGDRL